MSVYSIEYSSCDWHSTAVTICSTILFTVRFIYDEAREVLGERENGARIKISERLLSLLLTKANLVRRGTERTETHDEER